MSGFGTREEADARLAGLARFNEWEAKNPHQMSPQDAIANVGFLLTLLPLERRLQVDDPTYAGAKEMLAAFNRMHD